MSQPQHWQTRPCSADWRASGGEFGQVACYRLPVGTSVTRVVQDAWSTTPDQLLGRRLGARHQRLTRTFGPEEVLDIHDKGRAGVFVNFSRQGSPQDFSRRQLRQVALGAETSGAAVSPRHPWLRLVLGDERPDCREFAPLDTRFVADCRVEWRRMQSVDMTGGGRQEKTAPLLMFKLRPGAWPGQPAGSRPYAAYLGGWGACGPVEVSQLNPRQYADIWTL